ncbi:uncharacterized protein CELE_K06H7.1 [Caenorhabditis elegans]|uniref:Uncharacterized protein K06H7.1 n=1 Tax=Caenorhabditis elegans TaxID=6239 RepID=YMX1_CAEEL|nr:Uncharacterized protein CELE_K06H7.1 [Caenorhabditis elegans]P34509.2 RecName: Full=Uncharacterized protein K06H7.1 [Caenorhabditis elegans]CCD64451.1 Uncharacterized protein CELE_K06H7.1 [Caenorhabditis elegans]|eukprot:NP_498769.1 Uncharacterized protein CELE_K06H7.1 [Caenorhabditis elegans]
MLQPNFRRFEPSYSWKSREKSTENRGFLSRMCGIKQKMNKYNCRGKYQETNDQNLMQDSGYSLKIISSGDEQITIVYTSRLGKMKDLQVPEIEISGVLLERLEACNYRLDELFIDLKASKCICSSNELLNIPKIIVRRLFLKMESLEMLEWWIERVDPNSLNELCIAPHGEYPLDIPSKIFDLPHFQNCKTLSIMEHCSFSTDQFLALCIAIPNFSFYSDRIDENIVAHAIKKRLSLNDQFVVLEWFFTKHVNVEKVTGDLKCTNYDRKERFDVKTECFEPVDVYSVPDENNKKTSLLVLKDSTDNFKPYNIVAFS